MVKAKIPMIDPTVTSHYKTQEGFSKGESYPSRDPSTEKKSALDMEYAKEVAQGSSCSMA